MIIVDVKVSSLINTKEVIVVLDIPVKAY